MAGTWTEDKPPPPGQTTAHVLATRPLEADTARFYEIAGRETHAGETWLHIREAPGQQESPDDAPVEYWLLLDKDGAPVVVRRCQWTEGAGSTLNGTPIRESDVEDFTPTHEGDKIAPPTGAGD